MITQYIPNTPSGSTANVKAKGRWENGRWNLEFARKLDTNYPDDTAFDIQKDYKMGLAPFDHTGDMDMASGKFKLRFKK